MMTQGLDQMTETVTVLKCTGEGCANTFEIAAAECSNDGVHSLQAAMQAHRQGWKALDGQMLCPECAPETHVAAPNS